MAFAFQHIALMGTHTNPKVATSVREVYQDLQTWGLEICVEERTAAAAGLDDAHTRSLTTLPEHTDLAIVVGGDGNLLNAARIFAPHGVPVVGINRGTLGFLTDIAPHEIEKRLKPLLEGNFTEESRFLLEATITRNGEPHIQGNALNDIVLFPGDISQMIEFEVYIDERFVYSQRSDGLILSTPTGSTAYSLSAGGPILQPGIGCLVLVPMFPHTLTSRPIVVNANSKIDIKMVSEDGHQRLSFDGQSHATIDSSDVITVVKQPNHLRLLHPEDHNYYHTLRSKLRWGQRLPKPGENL
tara:strand:+ start:895 stop:1791 length:897 start_codon:yes stop_codon:yes gene_type:complete